MSSPWAQGHPVSGLRFHYREWGDGEAPPLLRLHAYTDARPDLGHFRPRDGGPPRVLALDQRGHGETEWVPEVGYAEGLRHADLRTFVEALSLGRSSLVGFSFGGATASSCAALYRSPSTDW